MELMNVNNEMTMNVTSEVTSTNAANAAQKKINMELTTVEALEAEGKEIVFLAFNRDVTNKTAHVKALAKSIKEEGLLTPLHLIPAKTALDEGIELLDSRGCNVTDGTGKYALIDGNNKYKAVQMLRSSKDAGRAHESIKCFLDENATNIQKMVMTMNNVVKPWGYADSIKAASKLKPNATIDFIKEKLKEGFTNSTLSLLLTGKKDSIKKEVIMKYNAGIGQLPECDIEKAEKIIAKADKAGFSKQFIHKRYLIETINGLIWKEYSLNKILETLEGFTKEEIQFAEDNGDLSLLAEKITKNENK